VVFPDQLSSDFRQGLLDSFPGAGDVNIPIDPENWITVTDGMAEVTQPGAFHTAGSAHLEGIDFGGKTGTAQLMSHEALGKTAKGKSTYPNVWFVGVTPRRNPELVVAVLWQNGEFSYYPARIGAKIVSAYVEKQRRLAKNLAQPAKSDKTDAPVEMSAVWTNPDQPSANSQSPSAAADRVQSGSFLVDKGGQIVARTAPILPQPGSAKKPGAPSLRPLLAARVGNHEPTAAPQASSSVHRPSGAKAGANNPQPARKPETPSIAKGQ
jgi:penicillin-binding protein 2